MILESMDPGDSFGGGVSRRRVRKTGSWLWGGMGAAVVGVSGAGEWDGGWTAWITCGPG